MREGGRRKPKCNSNSYFQSCLPCRRDSGRLIEMMGGEGGGKSRLGEQAEQSGAARESELVGGQEGWMGKGGSTIAHASN